MFSTVTHKSLESGATAVPVVPDFLKTMEFFVQNYFDVLGIPKMRSMVTCFMLGAGSVLHHQYDATIHNRYRLDIIGNFHLADSNIIQPPHAPNQ